MQHGFITMEVHRGGLRQPDRTIEDKYKIQTTISIILITWIRNGDAIRMEVARNVTVITHDKPLASGS